MAYGFLAKNAYGVVLSSQQKSFVFIGYYLPSSITNNIYTFTVPTATAQSIYGVRLTVGGQGAVISVIDSGSGFIVKVLGTNVLGLLAFSPINSGGHSGYGLALFNSSGECTFDSTQKPLVPSVSGNLAPGVSLTGTGDTVIYIGAGIYFSSITTTTTERVYDASSIRYWSESQQRLISLRVTYTDTRTDWVVSRNVVEYLGGSIRGTTLVHLTGAYSYMSDIQRWMSYNTTYFWKVSAFPRDVQASHIELGVQNLLTKAAADKAAANSFPYTTGQYNTGHNHVLLLDSSLYIN